MKLNINGEQKVLEPAPTPPTLSTVLKLLGYQPHLVVVEFNGYILTPKKWSTQKVRSGDTLEIVTIVGGGS